MTEPTFNGMTRKEIIRVWIKALESGEYKQGRKYLCRIRGDERSYCCLGVLCEVAHIPEQKKTTHAVEYKDNEDFNYKSLPAALSNFLRINSTGKLDLNVPDVTLASMNDNGADFRNIANVIRRGHVVGLEDAPELLKGM